MTFTAAVADAATTIDERPDTDLVSPTDVDKVVPMPGDRDRVLLDENAPRPEEGDPVVVPISAAAPEGVLGVVTDVHSIGDGGAAVETRPAPLGRAYSEIDLRNRTLAELTPGPSATTLLTQFKCTGAGKVDGPEIKPDLESLKLDLHMDLRQREFWVVLAGQPKIGVTISTTGTTQCQYVGHAGFSIVIPQTPILLKISPAAHAEASGSFKVSFSWGPAIAVGVVKPKSEPAQAIHTISTTDPELPSFEGKAHASLFLGFRLALSVAGRLGIQGTAGPEIAADLTADNAKPCLTATSSVAFHLSAFADVFLKHWDFPLKKGSFAERPLWKSCAPT
jgi:hypothetical protein